jgi:DNA-binding NtrC family response regulator
MAESKHGKILIVDDNEDLLKAAKMFLKRHFSQVDIEKNPEAIPALMNNEDYDVILLDMNFTKDVSSGSEGILLAGKNSSAGSFFSGCIDYCLWRCSDGG